ncbi:hypothetical protein [Micromonospora sp. CA-246542]|uniref:hypothetical protein n=1 Tax=Micromonospora sp. CA-246542 TaxID=3239959 RepID=UPI003D8E5BFE
MARRPHEQPAGIMVRLVRDRPVRLAACRPRQQPAGPMNRLVGEQPAGLVVREATAAGAPASGLAVAAGRRESRRAGGRAGPAGRVGPSGPPVTLERPGLSSRSRVDQATAMRPLPVPGCTSTPGSAEAAVPPSSSVGRSCPRARSLIHSTRASSGSTPVARVGASTRRRRSLMLFARQITTIAVDSSSVATSAIVAFMPDLPILATAR